jgi:hypothetical protein
MRNVTILASADQCVRSFMLAVVCIFVRTDTTDSPRDVHDFLWEYNDSSGAVHGLFSRPSCSRMTLISYTV